jgi:hypothetical protein
LNKEEKEAKLKKSQGVRIRGREVLRGSRSLSVM